MTNPGMQRNMNGSPSSKQLKIQTRSVRLVSIVERCAAKAYLVVAIPQQLKQATVKMLPKVSITSYFFSPNLGAMWLRLVARVCKLGSKLQWLRACRPFVFKCSL
jgi:hypothetical protein